MRLKVRRLLQQRSRDAYEVSTLPPDFDEALYWELNPDVAKNQYPAARHYLLHGRTEGRPYRRSDLPADFDRAIYLELNPDVAAEGFDPTQHYINHGRAEGRRYKEDQTDAGLQDFNVAVSTEPKPEQHYTGFFNHSGSDTFLSAVTNRIQPKVVAFYLPQYHRIKENDEWWGEGFTEWTNVRKGVPNFDGHLQPHVPLDDNYYDLSNVAAQINQATLAKRFGVDAFCYYMYWFNGRRVLERPLDQMLENKNVDIEFCICWANENWTRTWDGKNQDILLEQIHSFESDRQFIRDALKYLADPRYLRVDEKLMLLVYRTDLIPDCARTASMWREEVRRAGLGELHLCAVQFYGVTDPTPWGFDAAVEFPPHGWLTQENLSERNHPILNDAFAGQIFDYSKCITHALRKPTPSYTWYRGVFPGWDNTARRQNTPHIFADSHPFEFQRWLTEVLRQQVLMSPPEHQIVFINAWNEWGEGAHLEPDTTYGFLNLQALSAALQEVKAESEPLSILARLRTSEDYAGRFDDELSLLNLLRGQEQTLRRLMFELHERKV